MRIDEMQARAVGVREKFAAFERTTYGTEWTTEDLVMGLMTDVGDLAAIVQRIGGKRPTGDADPLEQLDHELSDCLWVLLVLAHRFDRDIGPAFMDTMDDIEAWLTS